MISSYLLFVYIFFFSDIYICIFVSAVLWWIKLCKRTNLRFRWVMSWCWNALCTDEQVEEADDDSDYDMSPATRRTEHIDHLTTSSSSLHTADGLTVSVVRGSITDQQVHASQCCVRHTSAEATIGFCQCQCQCVLG